MQHDPDPATGPGTTYRLATPATGRPAARTPPSDHSHPRAPGRGRARRGGAAGRAITKVKYAVRVSTSASGVRTNWLTGVGTSRVSRRAPPRTARHMQPNTRVSACRPRPAAPAPPPRPGGGAATLLCDAPAVPACLPRVNGNNAYFFLILYTFRARARDVRPRGRRGEATEERIDGRGRLPRGRACARASAPARLAPTLHRTH